VYIKPYAVIISLANNVTGVVMSIFDFIVLS